MINNRRFRDNSYIAGPVNCIPQEIVVNNLQYGWGYLTKLLSGNKCCKNAISMLLKTHGDFFVRMSGNYSTMINLKSQLTYYIW